MVWPVPPFDHAYDEKPEPASSVKVVFGQTCVGPVMFVVGGALIGIAAEPLLVQLPTVTTTESETLPLGPAVKVTLGFDDGLVNTPLVIVHA